MLPGNHVDELAVGPVSVGLTAGRGKIAVEKEVFVRQFQR
jgi:hypothetical protein